MSAIVSPAPSVMPMWTVYSSPSDFPGKFVVRKHEIRSGSHHPTAEHFVADTIEEVREHIPGWAIRFEREPADAPVIAEVWV